ncbi:hypothetical protein FNJ84_12350 [Paracoccus sp. M683]|nr:hypothetical protein FNJ84_12350 [Paracoccus sp. M683]
MWRGIGRGPICKADRPGGQFRHRNRLHRIRQRHLVHLGGGQRLHLRQARTGRGHGQRLGRGDRRGLGHGGYHGRGLGQPGAAGGRLRKGRRGRRKINAARKFRTNGQIQRVRTRRRIAAGSIGRIISWASIGWASIAGCLRRDPCRFDGRILCLARGDRGCVLRGHRIGRLIGRLRRHIVALHRHGKRQRQQRRRACQPAMDQPGSESLCHPPRFPAGRA